MKYTVLVVSVVLSICFISCHNSQSTQPQSKGSGVAVVKITFDEHSTFAVIARKAILTISASDYETETYPLIITDSTVEGLIEDIAAGKNRYFEISVFDSLENVQYKGSAYADVIADTTIKLAIEINRVIENGNVQINGVINESPSYDKALVAYYPFNGNAKDESGNEFDGSVKGATLTSDRFGNEDRAYYFDGESGIVAKVNSLLSITSFSMAAWFKHNGKKSERVPRIVAVARPGLCDGYYEFLFANGYWHGGDNDYSRKLIGYINNAEGEYGYNLYYSKSDIDSSSWHHGVIAYDDGELKFYIDGVLDTAVQVPRADLQFSGEAEIQIGFCNGDNRCPFNGSLDEIRIYNYSLSEDDIKTLFEEEEN